MNAIAFLTNHGFVEFKTSPKSTKVIFSLNNFEPFQTHAIHIHEFGDTREGCKSLGGHYNPQKVLHGNHAGDLIKNFTTDEKGQFIYAYHDSNFSVENILGRSVVIHKLSDDGGNYWIYGDMTNEELQILCRERNYKGLPTKKEKIKKLESESKITGNAGGRMDCAIIGRCP